MAPPNRRSPALASLGFRRNDLAAGCGSIFPGNSIAKLKAQPGRLVDRHGHEHSEAIFRNWTPAAIRALGIRRVLEGDADV